jgi:hypothetical protein
VFANPSRSPAVTYEIEGFDPSRFNDIHALLHVGADLLYASRIAVGRGVILIPCGVITHAGNHTLMVAHTNGTIIALNSIQVFKLPFVSAYSYVHKLQSRASHFCPILVVTTNEAEGYRGLVQHGGSPGWLEESDPAGEILYVMDGPYRLAFPGCPDRSCPAAS